VETGGMRFWSDIPKFCKELIEKLEISITQKCEVTEKRWRIETMFRVQDEARILSKSKDIRIRYFYFMYNQMLLLLWAGIFKEKLGFKEFLLVMTEYTKMRAEKEERKMQVPPWVSQRQRE